MKKRLLLIVVFGMLLVTFSSANAGGRSKDSHNEVGWEKTKAGCSTIQDGTLLNSAGDVITTGFDQWGYNYQAHMFNGGYCDSYRDAAWCQPYKDVDLIMKWNDAWLANVDCDGDGLLDRHFGFESYIGSDAWLTNHMWGNYWNLEGAWNIIFVRDDGVEFPHQMNVTEQVDGYIGGTGISGQWYYTFVGSVYGDSVEILATYPDLIINGVPYTYNAQGTIASDGSMSGTWYGSNGGSGDWYSVEGSFSESCDWDYFTKIVAAPANATTDGGVWYNADGVEIGPVIWGEFATIQEVENDPCAGIEGLQYSSPDHPGFGGW